MHLIVYSSQSMIFAEKVNEELTFIEAMAKVNNPRHGITGILLYFQGTFLQVLEGEERELRTLMNNITRDKRHRNIQYIADQKIETRGFKNWNMDFFNLEGDKKFNFDALKKLTDSFHRHLPNSDELVVYYKALLGLEEKYRDK